MADHALSDPEKRLKDKKAAQEERLRRKKLGKKALDEVEYINGYTKEKILKIPKGERPNPTEYLSARYIKNHLSKFEKGIVRFTSKASFEKYGTLGPEGAFILPKKYFDEILIESKGNLKIIEEKLGFEPGYLSDDDLMIVVLEDVNITKIRIPSGNETGANKKWIPGGFTSGKTPEAVIDLNVKTKFKKIKLK